MRILYLSQYFPPEVGATQTRAYEMACGLVRAGHHVTMVTEVPNHPTGVILPEYQGKWYERTNMNGIDVIRVWVKTAPEKTFRTRMAFYLSFMLMAIWAGLFLAPGKYDVIYATSPPLFAGVAALVISYLRRIPLVFEVRDLWPESAVMLGELKNGWAVTLAEWLEKACYRRAKGIVVVTQGILKRLIERGYPASALTLIPNGANTDLFKPAQLNQALRRTWNIGSDDFVLIFTGLHGLMHSLETAIEAAYLLREQSDIHFVFIGDGVRKSAAQAQAKALGLTNVRFLPFQPESILPTFIAAANAGLALGRKNDLSRGALPVKMFSYMACARPVLLAYQGEAAALISETQAGVVVEPENPQALTQAILKLKAKPDTCELMGQKGRQAVIQCYSRQALAHQLAELLSQLE